VAAGSRHLGGMRCSDHAGSRAARAVAPRGGFRAAGRSPKAMPLTSLAGGEAGQGCNRLNGQAGSDAQSADFTSWFGLASQGSRLARQLRRPGPCARRRPGSLPSSDPGSLGPGPTQRPKARLPGFRRRSLSLARKAFGFPFSIARDPSGSSFGTALKEPDLPPLVPGGQPGKGSWPGSPGSAWTSPPARWQQRPFAQKRRLRSI
jgi:hypothetical protein